MEVLFSVNGLIALLTLTLLEIVLGIDNIIFISLMSQRLPENQQSKARTTGLILALVARLLLLFGITFIMQFERPLFTIFNFTATGRDLILAAGGLFLLAKSTSEIHHKIEGGDDRESKDKKVSFVKVIIQIILLDIVFSFDSILTAIGMSNEIIIMVTAVIISMVVMMLFAGRISRFIQKHPTLQMLALSFLILIGFMLVIEALHFHVPKEFIYVAVAFSLGVELLNMKFRKKQKKS